MDLEDNVLRAVRITFADLFPTKDSRRSCASKNLGEISIRIDKGYKNHIHSVDSLQSLLPLANMDYAGQMMVKKTWGRPHIYARHVR